MEEGHKEKTPERDEENEEAAGKLMRLTAIFLLTSGKTSLPEGGKN